MVHYPAIDDRGQALFPQRYSIEILEDIRSAIGSYDFNSLYQGRPIARGGQYMKREWFKIIEREPEGLRWVRPIDLAVSTKKTADFSASLRMARQGRDLFIAAPWFARLDWPTCKRKIIAVSEMEGSSVPLYVEAVAGFSTAYSELKESLAGRAVVYKVDVHRDKLSRCLGFISAAEAGHVHIVNGPYVDELLYQLEAFPAAGVHDEGPDLCSMGHAALSRQAGGYACPAFLRAMQ